MLIEKTLIGTAGSINLLRGNNMAYTYRFILASSTITSKSTKDYYIDLFQANLDDQFYNSTDWWTIEEEYPAKSQQYIETDVRINHTINAETGVKLGDDWKTLLFPKVNHETRICNLFKFSNNTWLTVNTEVIKNLAATAAIRRCSNMLRWYDETTGALYKEPCAIDYLIKEPRDYSTAGSALVTPSGYIKIKTQFNERTNTIRPNQRFLFGNPNNWTCYKVVGVGAENYNNLFTEDNMSPGIINMSLVANFVNYDTDDIINGIADALQNIYTISITPSSINNSVGSTNPLSAIITFNGDTVNRNITWTSSDSRVATVDNSGVVTMIRNGTCTITANVENNNASDTCAITVSGSPLVATKVIFTPDTNYIYKGNTGVYSVHLYKNGIVQTDTFTITCDGGSIPSSNYTFTQIDGNSFAISNFEYSLINLLTITATSGSISQNMYINLKGSY